MDDLLPSWQSPAALNTSTHLFLSVCVSIPLSCGKSSTLEQSPPLWQSPLSRAKQENYRWQTKTRKTT